MKESTKYNSYRFVGNLNIDEIMPWFDFDKGKPWDESEVPWVLENKVRREIMIKLANLGPKTFEELYELINFSPKPLLIKPNEYTPKVSYQWNEEVLQNHLLNLEWYGLIQRDENKYRITIPVFTMEKLKAIDPIIVKFAKIWKERINQSQEELKRHDFPYEFLIEKSVETFYSLLKRDGLLPDVPNIKSLWAEQLRKIKFEEWVEENF